MKKEKVDLLRASGSFCTFAADRFYLNFHNGTIASEPGNALVETLPKHASDDSQTFNKDDMS